MRKLINTITDVGFKLFQASEMAEVLKIIDEEIANESETVNLGFEKGFNTEGILDFLLTSIDHRVESSKNIIPFHKWVKDITLDGKPFTYDRHKYLIEPYKDNHPHQVEMKGTQMGC